MRTLKNKQSKRGFTLVESAIVMLILAVVMGAAIVPYKLWRLNQITLNTNLNMDSVTAAFTNYITQNGRYPCPARMDIGRAHVDYGMEGICDSTDPGYPGVTTAGTCSGGFCYEVSERALDINPDPLVATLDLTPTIRRGSIPFRTLDLTEGQSEDGYGMRLQYAITENLTVPQTYVDISGGISIVDAAGQSFIDPVASAHYIILSSGRDKNGAVSREGIISRPCITGHQDTHNCDTAMVAETDNDKAIYSLAPYSPTGDAAHNDDTLKFYSSYVTPLWRKSSASGLHIRDLIDMPAGGRIGINTDSPQADVDVAGTVKVHLGYGPGSVDLGGANSLVDELCPKNAAGSCFSVADFGDPAPVAGDPFVCPAGSVATGFGAGTITCTTGTTVRCPAGERLTGVTSTGTLICGNFKGCPSINVNICGDITNLAASNRWRYAYPTGGPNNRLEQWHCGNNSPNLWHKHNKSGGAYDNTCATCTAGVVTTTGNTCASVLGGFWTGSVDIVTTTTCSPQLTTSTTDISGCGCANSGNTENRTRSCGSGLTSGQIIEERTWTCPTATTGGWSSWNEISNTCSCVPEVFTSTPSCPYAQSGAISRHKDFTCFADLSLPGVLDAVWTVDSDTCVCNAIPSVDTQVIGCPDGYAGNITQSREYNCAIAVWESWATITGGYQCGLIQLTWRAGSTVTGGTSEASIEVGDTCSAEGPGATTSCSIATGTGGMNTNYSDCVCE